MVHGGLRGGALAIERVAPDRAGDRPDMCVELVGCAERVTITVHEKCGHIEIGEVLCTEPLRSTHRMQRVAEQHHTRCRHPSRRKRAG